METKTIELTEQELNLLTAVLMFGNQIWKNNPEKNAERIKQATLLIAKLNQVNDVTINE